MVLPNAMNHKGQAPVCSCQALRPCRFLNNTILSKIVSCGLHVLWQLLLIVLHDQAEFTNLLLNCKILQILLPLIFSSNGMIPKADFHNLCRAQSNHC